MPNAPTILMIPVSSPSGIGEYMRCLIIAEALKAQHPDYNIRFVLNRHAPSSQQCPFPVHLLDNSATKEKAAVKAILDETQPDLVIFDCSGRASQARYAKKLGARVVFVSQHKKKRAKGFALNRLIALDAHWITQFKFIDGDVSPLERFKLRLLKKPAPLFTGPVFAEPAGHLPAHVDGLEGPHFSLWAAGGGGHTLQGLSATEVFYQAALKVATPEQPAVFITGGNFKGELPSTPQITVLRSVPNRDLMTLIANANLVVSGGGDMMGQAIVLGRNIVAVPVAKDQPDRVFACATEGLVRPATFSVDDLAQQCQKALEQPLSPNLQQQPGLALVLDDIQRLLALANRA